MPPAAYSWWWMAWAGRRPASLAAQTAVEAIREALDEPVAAPPPERVCDAITAANNRIYPTAQQDQEHRGMACVLTLALVADEGGSPSDTWAIRASI